MTWADSAADWAQSDPFWGLHRVQQRSVHIGTCVLGGRSWLRAEDVDNPEVYGLGHTTEEALAHGVARELRRLNR